MVVTIVGAGGVGGYIGLRLAQAGHDVRFLARGRSCEALRSHGLRVMTPAGAEALPTVTASAEAADLGASDAVIVAVKNYDLAAVAATLVPLIQRGTVVLPLQNGVDAHGLLQTALPEASVVKGTVSIKSALVEPGVIVCKSRFCRIKLGSSEARGAPHFARVLDAAPGIEAALSPDIDRDLWLKFLMLSSFSAVACLARATIGEVKASPAAYDLVLRAAQEAAAVGRAQGVDLPGDIEGAVHKQVVDMPDDGRASMLEDLEAGRRLELDWLSGTVVRLGAAAGIDTPIHAVAHAALSLHAAGIRR